MSELVEQYEFDGYEIKDDFMAEKAARRIKETQAEVDRMRAHYEEQISKMQERADGIRAFYMGHLERYYGKVPHKETKTQTSYDGLPSAKLVYRKPSQEFVRDVPVAVEFLEGHNYLDYIKVEKKLDWQELKKNIAVVNGQVCIRDSGEFVPGITVQEKDGEFQIKFRADEFGGEDE